MTDLDPVISAQNMVDKHTVKMILEVAQILSTTHRYIDGKKTVIGRTPKGKPIFEHVLPDNDMHKIVYKMTHVNHPSTVWARQSSANYKWLYDHFIAACDEYTHRYEKTHLTDTKFRDILSKPPINIPTGEMTKMPSCMDEKYIISNDPVVNYRNYYNHGKSELHVWTNRLPPEWIIPHDGIIYNKKRLYENV